MPKFGMYSIRRLWTKYSTRYSVVGGSILLLVIGITVLSLTHQNSQLANIITRDSGQVEGAPTVSSPQPALVTIEEKMEKFWNDQRWERLNTMHINIRPKGDGIIRVLLTSDERTLPGMITAINSIRKNTRHPVKFYLMTNAHSRQHLEDWIQQSPELKNIKYSIAEFDMESIQKFITVRGPRRELMDPLNYARYYVLDYFKDIIGRLIYIDSDCLVLGDLKELNDMDFQGENLIAFSDDCDPAFNKLNPGANTYRHYLNFSHPLVRKLRISPKTCSFNAGVYVADMEAWRSAGVQDTLDHWTKMNHETEIYGESRHSYGSQPPMMITFYDRFDRLEAAWNVRHLGNPESRGLYKERFLHAAKLLHWSGPSKPWRDVNAVLRLQWKRYFVPDPTMKFLVP